MGKLMNIDLNFEIRSNQYPLVWNVILHLLHMQQYRVIKEISKNYPDNLEAIFLLMENYGLIKITGELTIDGQLVPRNLSIRDKALVEILGTDKQDMDEFIEEYRELFPKGYKGDPKGCKLKMIRFLKEYKYSKELILKATKFYNDMVTMEGKDRFRQQAHYFIKKEQLSNLAAYCERVKEGEIEVNNDRKDRL
jgi:hypothetical protein